MPQEGHDSNDLRRRAVLKGFGATGIGLSVPSVAAQLPNTIRIIGGSPSQNVNYTFTVSGEAALGSDANHEDRVEDGDTVKGIVAGGVDSHEFSGQITSFRADGDLTVEINGQVVDDPVGRPRTSGGGGNDDGSDTRGGDDGSSALPRTIAIRGGSPQQNVNYTFTVSGEAALGPDANHEDRVESGDTVKGIIAGGIDSYRFSGEITSFQANGDLTIEVDGRRVSDPVENPRSRPDDGPSDGDTNTDGDGCPNVIEIAGGSWRQNVNYTFVVDGAAELGSQANHEDRVENDTIVKGIIAGGADSYRFSGRIVSFWSDGDLSVTVNGQRVDDPVGEPTQNECDHADDDVDCEPVPTDVVIALDTSESMTDQPNKFSNAKAGAIRLVDHLTSEDRVAVVSFDDTASLEIGLTQRFDRIERTIETLEAGGSTDIAGAIRTAQSELDRGRQADQCLVLLSDGRQTASGDPRAEARRAKDDGTRLLTVAYGDDADDSTLRQVASDPPRSNAFVAARTTIEEVFDAIAREVCE